MRNTPTARPARSRSIAASVSILALLLSACGGSDGSSGGGTVAVTPTPTPTPTPTSGACSLASRQNFALTSLNQWYLFPNDLATGVNPASYSTLSDYVDALTAPARAAGKDRYFTYVTSITEENAFYASGSSAGFGMRISTSAANRVFIAEAFEGAPALAAGIDRGTEIVGIGTDASNVRSVSDIIASGGSSGVTNALGPTQAGITRVLRIIDPGATTPHDVSVTKADYDLTPVSSRYGARIIDDNGHKVGYINLRTFITAADAPLRNAFANFRANGVTDIVIDLRYNGGGLLSIADVMGDLIGQGRAGQIWSRTLYRPEKSNNNSSHPFTPTSQSIAPTRIAFIGTGGTASASELVMYGTLPYFGNNVALVGANTYGKPVGQIALDLSACDDRLRVIAFAVGNANGQADYFTGIAPKMPNTCAAADEVALPLGDPREASLRTAIDFLDGRACTPIASGGQGTLAAGRNARAADGQMTLLVPDRPTPAQHEVPGLF